MLVTAVESGVACTNLRFKAAQLYPTSKKPIVASQSACTHPDVNACVATGLLKCAKGNRVWRMGCQVGTEQVDQLDFGGLA